MPAGFWARGWDGRWNKASAFLREGVSETRPVNGEKLTPYLPHSRLPARRGGGGGAGAPARGAERVDRSPLPTSPPPHPDRPMPPNHSRFREAALSAER